MNKACKVCGGPGPFGIRTEAKDGLRSECKPCRRQLQPSETIRMRGWRSKNPGAIRKYKLKREYNMTPDEVNALIQRQNGLCALCFEPLDLTKTSGPKSVNIDHDHACCDDKRTCGKCVRGVLHSSCNAGLGMFKDNTSTLQKAIAYIEHWKSRTDDST